MADSKIKVILEAQDKLTKELKRVEKQSKGFAKTFKSSALEINAKLELIGKAARAVAKAFEFIERGAKFSQTKQAFKELADSVGADADSLVRSMQKMSGETLSTSEIMRNASRAMALGIETSKLPELMEISRAAARAFGQDVSFMFDSIVLGIGRQSRLILDNLGIIVSAKEAYQDYANSLGKNVKALTEAQRRQAFLNAAVKQGKELVDKINLANSTQLENIKKLKSKWTDFVDTLSEFLSESPEVRKAIVIITDAIDLLINKMRQMSTGTIGKLTEELDEINRLVSIQANILRVAAAAGIDITVAEEKYIDLLRMRAQKMLEIRELQSINLEQIEIEKQAIEETSSLLEQKRIEMELIKNLVDASIDSERNRFEAKKEGVLALAETMQEIQKKATFSIDKLLSKSINTLHKGLTKAFSSIILGTKKTKEAFKDLGNAMVETIVNYLAEFAAAFIISKTIGKAIETFVVTSAANIGAAWAPAAAMASLATLGANSGPATAALVGTTGVAVGLSQLGQVNNRAFGGDDVVTKPTLFLAGEAGPERATFTPLNRASGTKPMGDGVNITINNPQFSDASDIDLLTEEISYRLRRESERI